MDPLPELTEWLESYYDEATSFALQVCKADDTTFRTYRKGQVEDADPSQAAQLIVQWAKDFTQVNEDGRYQALVRYRKEDGSSSKSIRNFMLAMPEHAGANPFALTEQDLGNNPGLKIFMQLVDGERRRTEQALFISRQREDKLFDTVIKTIEVTGEDRSAILSEMREERQLFLSEMREERQSHRDSIGPILQQSANALANAAELVKVHQEKNTQVQLAELEYKADKERTEMYMALGGPFIKKMADRIKLKQRKKKSPQADDEITVTQEDQAPPKVGPTRDLFLILEKLSDEQLEDVKRLLGEEMFNTLDDAAHSGDDKQTRNALTKLKSAYDKEGKIQGFKKLMELSAVLGDELSDRFITLFSGDDSDEGDAEEAEGGGDETPEESNAKVIPIRKKEGYVQGLRDAGLDSLTEDQTVAVGEQLGPELTGVLIAAAEGEDEDKAFAAVCTLGARLNQLAQETSPEDAEQRLETVLDIIEDNNEASFLVALIAQATDELEPN